MNIEDIKLPDGFTMKVKNYRNGQPRVLKIFNAQGKLQDPSPDSPAVIYWWESTNNVQCRAYHTNNVQHNPSPDIPAVAWFDEDGNIIRMEHYNEGNFVRIVRFPTIS